MASGVDRSIHWLRLPLPFLGPIVLSKGFGMECKDF